MEDGSHRHRKSLLADLALPAPHSTIFAGVLTDLLALTIRALWRIAPSFVFEKIDA